MSEKLVVKNPIYPILGTFSSILIIVIGLITAKGQTSLIFSCACWLIFLCYGYWKACLAVIPVAAVMCAVLAGLTWLISGNVDSTMAAAARIAALCIGVIPGIALKPILLVRNLSQLKMPRAFTLAMMITFSFFPLLGLEVKRVREAMKTRGAGSLLSPAIFYRAFLIPLLMRIVNISDTLALSVETRGFVTDSDAQYSVFKTVSVRVRDIIFLVVIISLSVLAVVFR